MGENNRDGLTPEELAAQQGEPLPAREVMSIVATEPHPMPVAYDDPQGPYSPDPDPASTEPTTSGSDPQASSTPVKEGGPEPVPPADDNPERMPPGADPAESSRPEAL